MLTFGSVCSGIEAASVAWEPLGFKALWFSEIDNFPSAVLKHHWPDIPNLGDMTKIHEKITSGAMTPPDILVGGTPCQSFSIAGYREGLNDSRGQLTLSFTELADVIDETRKNNKQPESIIVWENVPGVLSSRDNAFGQFIGKLAGEKEPLLPAGGKWTNAGYVSGPKRNIAWRVLDAQYFGVPQRRRRLFVVASARKGFDTSKILFESNSVCRNTAKGSREGNTIARSANSELASGKSVTGPILANCGQKQWLGNQEAFSGDYRVIEKSDCAAYTIRYDDVRTNSISPTLTTKAGQVGNPSVISLGRVRRLTPIECERLQGFFDNFTKVPFRKKSADDCPDSPRYKALGNSMAVPVMHWIGRRIKDYLLENDKM